MDIQIEWQKALNLRSLTADQMAAALEELDSAPGIYIFARKWGTRTEALYVGKAKGVVRRVKQQFNNRKLIEHVMGARNGTKILIVGYLARDGRTNVRKALDIAERALIRYFLTKGDDLHNTMGTRIRRHEIISTGTNMKKVVPTSLRVEY